MKQAGFSKEAFYKRRNRDPRFALHWQEALAQGYARLEAALVKGGGRRWRPRARSRTRSADDGQGRDAILKLHRDSVHGAASARLAAAARALAEVKQSILTKLAALERARGKGQS